MSRTLAVFILAAIVLPASGVFLGPPCAQTVAQAPIPAGPHDAAHAGSPTSWCAAHASKNELVQALSDCNYALSLDPDNVQALSNRGSIYLLAKDARAALADFERAISLRSSEAVLHFNRGVAYDDLGQSDLAIADYSEAIKLSPDFAAALHNRGYQYERKGQRDLAVADYEAALRVKPDLKQTLRRLESLRNSL